MNVKPSHGREDVERTASAMTERAPDPLFSRDTLREGGLRDRSLPSLRAETGAALERQLLLVSAPGDDSTLPGTGSRWSGRFVLAGVLATLAISSVLFFVEVRGHWKDRVAALEGEMERARSESALREEALRREGADKDRQLAERRTENQSLSTLANKTMEELKTALSDLRHQREETLKLQGEVRTALEARPARWLETLVSFLQKHPRGPVEDAPGEQPGSE